MIMHVGNPPPVSPRHRTGRQAPGPAPNLRSSPRGGPRWSPWCRWEVSALLLGLLFLAPALLAQQSRLGWHGETMPVGLAKGEAEGEYVWQKDGAIMVYVPPGEFPMGRAGGAADEGPVHRVHLDGYYIDKYEVTWGQWKKSGLPYLKKPNPRLPQPSSPDWGIVDDQPAVNVSWKFAQKYLAWAGKRLPTEAEWEKAARGTDGRTYPWGNEPPTFDRAVWRDHPVALRGTESARCCTAGASPYGVVNMAGNVYEWCQDTYRRDFYAHSPASNPLEEVEGQQRVLRGGAFVLEKDELSSTYRYRLWEVDKTPYIGFRAVVSGQGGG
jgi:formylglycine-generating enzyme required for sulfatase activity